MARAYIGLGSNLGDGKDNLRRAWQLLGERAGIKLETLSSPYLTRPMPKPEWLRTGRQVGEQLFTNAVGMVESRLLPLELLAAMQEIEVGLGRDRSQTVDRPVDLDLLYYDDLVLAWGELLLPHPELQNRRFVLVPMLEVAPEFRHPVLGQTTSQLLAALPVGDAGEITRQNWQITMGNGAGISARQRDA